MMKKLLHRLFASFAALLALAPAAATAASTPPAARPALWAVSDADTTVYLVGTIHLLPENYQWRTAKLDEVMGGSQQLVVETIVDEKNPQKLFQAMASLAFSPGLQPLADRVPAAKRADLIAAVKKSGFPPQALDKMETWAAAFILLGNQYRDMGLKGQEGVEMVLRRAFATQNKPVGELESNVEQLSFFDKLPETAQRQLLEGAIDQSSDTRAQFDQMLSAWARGDVKGIARSFNRDLAGSPALREALLTARNANWTRWIEQRMAQPGAIMVAVGSGHLAGPDSVVSQLKRDGYRVTRIQ
jgi:uncharacterized protein YbaP (TraB family)